MPGDIHFFDTKFLDKFISGKLPENFNHLKFARNNIPGLYDTQLVTYMHEPFFPSKWQSSEHPKSIKVIPIENYDDKKVRQIFITTTGIKEWLSILDLTGGLEEFDHYLDGKYVDEETQMYLDFMDMDMLRDYHLRDSYRRKSAFPDEEWMLGDTNYKESKKNGPLGEIEITSGSMTIYCDQYWLGLEKKNAKGPYYFSQKVPNGIYNLYECFDDSYKDNITRERRIKLMMLENNQQLRNSITVKDLEPQGTNVHLLYFDFDEKTLKNKKGK